MASEVLITISRDEVERARLNSELKWELDTQSKLTYFRKQTIQAEQGKREAEQGKREAEQERDAWQKAAADKDIEIAQLQAQLKSQNP